MPEQTFTSINIFTPIEGGLDALIAFQIAEMRDMAAESTATGWLGNEVYRAVDGSRLIVITRFRSQESQQAWAATERFQRHVRDLAAYVTSVEPVPVELVAAHGDSPWVAAVSGS